MTEDQHQALLAQVYRMADRHDRRSNEHVAWMAVGRRLHYGAIRPGAVA